MSYKVRVQTQYNAVPVLTVILNYDQNFYDNGTDSEFLQIAKTHKKYSLFDKITIKLGSNSAQQKIINIPTKQTK